MLLKVNALLKIIKAIYKDINKNCQSDLGVAVEMASSSINGATMNIKINLKEISSKKYIQKITKKINQVSDENDELLFELNKNINI